MAQIDEGVAQMRDHTFRAAIELRGNGFIQRGDLGNFHERTPWRRGCCLKEAFERVLVPARLCGGVVRIHDGAYRFTWNHAGLTGLQILPCIRNWTNPWRWI